MEILPFKNDKRHTVRTVPHILSLNTVALSHKKSAFPGKSYDVSCSEKIKETPCIYDPYMINSSDWVFLWLNVSVRACDGVRRLVRKEEDQRMQVFAKRVLFNDREERGWRSDGCYVSGWFVFSGEMERVVLWFASACADCRRCGWFACALQEHCRLLRHAQSRSRQ